MRQYLDDFVRLTAGLAYRQKGIFPSEMFLFYCRAKQAGADHIIETGVGYGGSTSYLARLFPDVPITSIDRNVRHAAGLGVKVARGDAQWVLPDVVRRSSGNALAILIDGPKGPPALDLARRFLGAEKVKVIAVHDLAFEAGDHRIDSHADEFRDQYGFLDARVGVALKKHPRGPGLSLLKC